MQNERLLDSWLRLSTSIMNPRVVSSMSYNESLVCNVLYRQHCNGGPRLTATDLCNETKILKSQMNRILTSLEDREIIKKERSSSDKRLIYLALNEDKLDVYLEQHARILELLDSIIKKLGPEKTAQAIEMFDEISTIADSLLGGKSHR